MMHSVEDVVVHHILGAPASPTVVVTVCLTGIVSVAQVLRILPVHVAVAPPL